MRWIANLAYLLAAVIYLPVLCYQMIAQRKNRGGWAERFGRVGIRPSTAPTIWVHAVSLGEVNAARRIVESLRQRFSDHRIVVSATTDTGYARACELFGADVVFRFPLDFSWVVSRVLDRVRPRLIVLMELEIWFNLSRMAAARGVRIAIANGRLTERSARRLGRLGPIARSMFRCLDWVGAQDETIASRFRALGVSTERVQITGSVKWDTAAVADTVAGADALAEALGIDRRRPLWVCGSTGPGEEDVILDAQQSLLDGGIDIALAIVPRKPERFDEVARLIRQRGFGCRRRSEHPDGGTSQSVMSDPRDIVLGDTMGELRKFYVLAEVVFVGRSLAPMGGSDPMEVAALSKPILAGPHMENFAAPVDVLRTGGALRVVTDSTSLADAVRAYASDPESARRDGQSARDVVLRHQGATAATLDALARLIAP